MSQSKLVVRRLAEYVCSSLDSKDYVSEYLALYNFLLQKTRYMRDPRTVELVRAPYVVAEEILAGGRPNLDCDDLAAMLVPDSVSVAANGAEVTATYRVAAPGNTWDPLDFGRYMVSMVNGQVTNGYGLSVAAAELGQFSVRIDDATVSYVNTFADAVDANVGDGICASANGNCSLRAAIQEANAAAPAARTVILAASASRISPTKITSGSCRRIERSPAS